MVCTYYTFELKPKYEAIRKREFHERYRIVTEAAMKEKSAQEAAEIMELLENGRKLDEQQRKLRASQKKLGSPIPPTAIP